jgi:predicted TIM-barrel fold metal-dependent hydrolase
MRLQQTPKITFKGNIIDSHSHLGEWYNDKNFQPSNLTDFAKDSFEITVNGKKQTDEIECILVSNLSCLLKKQDGKFLKNETDGNKELLEQCKQNPKLKAEIVCQPGVGKAENIDTLLKENEKDIYALKFHPQESNLPANDAAYEPYMKIAQKYKKPCVFHSDRIDTPSSPYKIYELAKKTPNVPVVLYHMSMASGGKLSELPQSELKAKGLEGVDDYVWNHREKWNRDGISVVKESIAKKDANLFLEVSWTKPETIIEAIKEVGADKVLFGTDAPLGEMGNAKDYRGRIVEVKNAIKQNFDNADEIINKVFFENSNKLFFNSKLKMEVNGQEIKPPPSPPKPKGKFLPIISGVIALGGIGAFLFSQKKSKSQNKFSDEFVKNSK